MSRPTGRDRGGGAGGGAGGDAAVAEEGCGWRSRWERDSTLALDGERMLVPGVISPWSSSSGRLEVPYERTRAVFVPLGHGHRHD